MKITGEISTKENIDINLTGTATIVNVSMAPYIGENGNWFAFDNATNKYYDTGIRAAAYEISVNDEIIEAISGVVNITIPTQLSELVNDSEFVTINVADLVNYYTKEQTLTKEEINSLLESVNLSIVNQINAHILDKENPHSVTKEQVGLSKVKNIDTTNASNIDSGILDPERLSEATQTKKGALSTFDKIKLDGIEEGSEKNKIIGITLNGQYLEIDSNRFVNIVLDVISGVKLQYNSENGVISLLDKNNDILSSVDLPLELLVDSGYYDNETKSIVLVLANLDRINIPVEDLIDEYFADEITISKSQNNTFSIKTEVYNKIIESFNKSSENGQTIANILNGNAVVKKSEQDQYGNNIFLFYAKHSDLEIKVDKIEGKSLSENDFTNEYKNKLENIEDGAQVNTVNSVAGKKGNVSLSKEDVGLSNVDNTSDTQKPISDLQQKALDKKADKEEIPDVSQFIKKDVSDLENYYDKETSDNIYARKDSLAYPVTSVDGKNGDIVLSDVYLPIINKTLPSLTNNNVPQSTLLDFCDSFNLKYGESTLPLYFESGTNYSNIKGLIQPSGVAYKQYNFLQVTRQASGMYMITVYSDYNNQVQLTIPPQFFFVSGGGISPATSNYALKSEVVKLSATTGVTTNKEEWGLSAASGAGTYLIGTFKIYDTNIHLRVTGGSGSSIITDVDILINCTNCAIDRAICYANTLYTSSALTGVYCTLDSSHNLRIYIASPNYGKFFVSASVVGGTIVDKGSSSTQSPSNGFYIFTKYYLSLDPTALDPLSGDNWSVGLSNSVLPNGKYAIALAFSGVIYYGEAIANNGKWISVIPIDIDSSTVVYAFLSKMRDNVTFAQISGEVKSATFVNISRSTSAITYYYKKL